MSTPYTTSWTFDNLTGGDLSFTYIMSSETDYGSYSSFTDNAGDPYWIGAGNEQGMEFAGFDAAAFGIGSSTTFTLSYNVTVTNPSEAITSIQQFYLVDALTANSSASAVEQAYDSSGNLVATLDWNASSHLPGAQMNLLAGYQSLNIVLTINASSNGAGTEASISTLDQNFGLTSLSNMAVIGDNVFLDNADTGVQSGVDAGPGVPGVTVNLLEDISGNYTQVASTTTDSNGLYQFIAQPGTYEVQFVSPLGYTLSPQGPMGSDLDSTPNQTSGVTPSFVVTQGETIAYVDAGLVPPASHQNGTASIGDNVWLDSADTGIQSGVNAGPGVAGVTVDLLQETSGNFTQVATTSTDSNGLYSFDSLNAGTYEVQFVAPNGYFYSPQGAQGSDLDSTANTTTGITQPITLATGQAITWADAGLVPVDASVTLQKFVSIDGGASWVAAPTTSGEPIMLNDSPAGSPEYEFVVTNNGNVALSNVTLADSPLNIGTVGNIGSLAVGASDTVVATGTWVAGQNTDIATTTGTYIGTGITSTPTATATGNYFGAAPGVSVEKFVSVDGGTTWVSAPTATGEPTELAGGPAPEFEFVVTNTGNVAENVVVYDTPHINSNSLGAVGTITNLGVGASSTIVATGTWAAGQNADVGSAVGSYTDSTGFFTTTPTSFATGNYFGDQPSIAVQKYVSVDGGAIWDATPTGGLDPTMLNDNPAGSPEYEFIVTNVGNVALNNVTLTDAALAGGAANLGTLGNIGTLGVGASTTIVATGTWAAGQNTDLATATGTVIANGITATPSMTAIGNYFGAAPGVSIEKFVSVDGGNTWVSAPTANGEPTELAGGPAPEFEFVVTNTGNVVENVVVDDAPLLVGQVGSVAGLGIGASATLFATGTWSAGQQTDVGTAVGSYTDSTGFFATTTATATGNYFGDQPVIGVQKLESLNGGVTWITQTAPPGEPIDLSGAPAPEFEFIVTNLGNVALNNVTLTDAAVAGSVVNLGTLGNIGSLGVGASTTITATGTWAAGQNTDLATATGTVVVNGITATPTAIATENYFGGSPSIGVQKFVSVDGGTTWVSAPTSSGEPTELAGGPAPEFEFVVTNTGNILLHNVVLSDSPLSLGAAGNIGTLAVGASDTIVATGTWAAGQDTDIATATGTDVVNGITAISTATATGNYFGDSPNITLQKFVSVNSGATWVSAPTTGGEPVELAGGPAPEYEFVVTNNGNVALNNVSLTDAVALGGAINLGALGNIGSLAVGASDTIVATGTWAAGQNTDNASVVGTVIANGITSTPSATATANYFGDSPSITLVKYVSVNGGSSWVLAPTTSGDPTELSGGPAPEYEFVVTNNGNVALSNVALSDAVALGGAINLGALGNIGSLAVGASDTVVATGTWAAGQNTDNASVTGTVIANGITATPSATATANYFGDSPSITLVKYVSVNGGSSWVLAPTTSGDPTELSGGPAPEYEFVVTNNGNVALNNVSLTDSVVSGGAINLGALGNIGSLAVGATDTIVATGTWAAGQNTDNAKVAGTVIANGITATPTATATANYFGDSPAITLVKYVSVNGGTSWVLSPTISGEPSEASSGPAPEYEFVVTNSGNVALTNVSLSDTVVSGGAINLGTLGNIGSLAVGATDTIVATGTWAAGQNTDDANVVGTVIANGITATPSASAAANWLGTTPVTPGVSIVKTVTSVGGVAGDGPATYVGEVIDYKVVVTNTGNEALTNVNVGDTTLGTTLGTLASLGIGQSVTYTASETVTQADLNQILGTSSGCGGSVTHTGPGSGAGSGCTAWFSSTFNPTSCANGATYTFKGITCTISGQGTNGSPITEKCPDATITFSSSCNAPSTVFNSSTNCWVTTLPANCNPGSIFLSGLPVTVPSGCNFNNSTITWSIGQSTNNCGATNISWDASCGGFDNFSQNGCNGLSNYNQIGVQSCDNIGGITSGWGWNSTTTCAGTPQNQYNSNNCNSGSYTQGSGNNSGSCDGSGCCVSTPPAQTNVSGNDIINTATVTDTQGATGSSTASTVVQQAAPSVSIVKSVTSVGGTSGDPAATYVGEAIAYSVVVANTGNEALTNVVVTDATLGTTLGTLPTLAVGASQTYTVTSSVTQAEINSGGPITDTATVTDSQGATGSSTASTNVTQTPGISIVKTVTSVGGVAGDPSVTTAGEVIDYKVVVTNTGNETLTNVVVGDTTLGTTLGTLASLAPGATTTYTAAQTVTQAEINQALGLPTTTTGSAGSVCHTAPSSGLGSGCAAWLSSTFNPTSCADGATYNFKGITCTISGPGTHGTITENCPNATITFSSSCSQPSTVFNASTNCWVTTLPANSNPGSVFLSGLPCTVPSGCNFNNATITWSIGQSSNNCGASNVSWDASCGGFNNFDQSGCNGLSNYNQIGVQSCDNIGGISSGNGWNSTTTCAGTPQNQYNNYNCNSGSYTQGSGSSGGSCGCTGTCTTASNVSGDDIINTATVTDSQGVTGSSTASTVVALLPSVSIAKTVTSVGGTNGDPAATYAGEVIAYSVVVTNTGDEALTNVAVTDATLGKSLGTISNLAVGASQAYTVTQTVTQAQIDNGGPVTDTATVTDTQGATGSSTASTNVLQQPGVSIVKSVTSVNGVSGDPAVTTAGEVIDYQVVVTNTGNETLTNVAVNDTTLNTTLGTISSLAPGASQTYTTSMTVTQAEINQALGSTANGCVGSVTHTAPSSGLGSGCTAWLNSSFNPTSCANGATYNFKGITCTISGPGTHGTITEACPDATITFSSSCSQPSTVFNASTNCWVTTLPANSNPGSVFLSGLPCTVPSGCNFNNATITWSIGQSSNNCGASSVSWDASCGGFNNFDQSGCNGLSNYNQIGVQSCDNIGGITGGYGWNSTTTCAGTPQNQYNSNNCNSGSYTQGSGSGNSCGGSGSCTSTCVTDTINNTATVTDSQGVTGSSTASTTVVPPPSISINKSPSVTAIQLGTNAGVSYTYTVTNTGATTLNNVAITDVVNGSTTYTYTDPNSLAAGATWTYTAAPVASVAPTVPTTAAPTIGTAGGSGFTLGDAANYTLLDLSAGTKYSFQGTSDSPIFGNVGIGGGSGNYVQLSSDTITGSLVTTGTAPASTGGTVTGGITGNSAILASDIAALESLNTTLGREAGTSVNLSTTTTLNATSGVLDADGNYVFNVTALPTTNSLTIVGAGNHGVVLNYSGTSGWDIKGNVTLSGGLTPNQVLFNLTGSGGQLQGAQPVVFNASILAPNQTVNIDGMTLNGHLYADNNIGNFQWVSGAAADNPSAYGVTDIATVTGSNSGGTATATDMARVEVGGATAVGNGHSAAPTPTVQVGGTAPTGNLFSLEGGNAATLELQYSPGSSVSTLGQNSIAATSGATPPSMAFIVVSNSAGDFTAGATDFFMGTVTAGSDFYADATTSATTGLPTGGSFAGDMLYAHIFSSEAAYNAGQAALQEDSYDVSGAHSMALGDVIGSLKVAGYISTTNHGYVV